MKSYEIILFDLDGTLTDTGRGVTNSVMYALNKFNIQVENRSELYKFIGPPLHKSFEEFYGFSPQQAQLAVSYYREYYADKGIYENEVYSGMCELLHKLKSKGKTLVVATSKPEMFAKIVIESNNMTQFFDYIAGANMDGTRTNKADIIKYALKSVNCNDISTTVIIGDRKHDVIGAKTIGIDSIGVLFGYGSRTELENAGATYILENVKDIYDLICR